MTSLRPGCLVDKHTYRSPMGPQRWSNIDGGINKCWPMVVSRNTRFTLKFSVSSTTVDTDSPHLNWNVHTLCFIFVDFTFCCLSYFIFGSTTDLYRMFWKKQIPPNRCTYMDMKGVGKMSVGDKGNQVGNFIYFANVLQHQGSRSFHERHNT